MGRTPNRRLCCAITGDVVGPRMLGDRDVFRSRFLAGVDGLNALVPAEERQVSFSVVAGDEFWV